jgi:hypothetical protein
MMKHVFTIHSPITFLAAHAVIAKEAIAADDVLVLSNGYRPPVDTPYRVVPFLHNLTRSWFAKIRHLNMPLASDRYLESFVGGEPFLAYIDLMHYDQAVLWTHRQCVGLRFIEEGAFAYRRFESHETLTHAWKVHQYPHRIQGIAARWRHVALAIRWAARGYSHSLLATPNSYNAYVHLKDIRYYGFSEYSFPHVPSDRKVVLDNVRTLPEIDEMARHLKLENTFIWVDGARGNFTKVSDTVYHRAIDKAIELFKNELMARGVQIKLRGDQHPEQAYLYQALKRLGCPLEVMSNQLVLECVFMNARSCTVIGNVSPALMYAKMFGLEAYSIYSLYDERVPGLLDDLPAFWQLVQALEMNARPDRDP